jgi:hypothetical protein
VTGDNFFSLLELEFHKEYETDSSVQKDYLKDTANVPELQLKALHGNKYVLLTEKFLRKSLEGIDSRRQLSLTLDQQTLLKLSLTRERLSVHLEDKSS